MLINPKKRNIAYRCPECASSVMGIVGKFALAADMIRLKCSCEQPSALDIKTTNDGKIRLSVPCIFCKQNHSYVVSEGVFFDRDKFLLSCPYAAMDIAFLGDEESINDELVRTERELRELMANLEAEDIADIQPEDMSEDEILPDPAVYDTIRFVIKDLEEEGKIHCPCGEGTYDLRFTDTGVQVYCERCGATCELHAMTPAVSEEYLSLDRLDLK